MRQVLFLFLVCSTLFAQLTVDNKLEVRSKAKKVRFKELSRFGNTEDDSYFWQGNNSSVAVGSNGHLYVSDAGNKRILEYDAAGKFVKALGKTGQGPGEYSGIPYLMIFSDGSALGCDMIANSMPKFNFYDANLNYKSSKTGNQAELIPIMMTGSNPSGSMISALFIDFKKDGSGMDMVTGTMDANFKMLERFYTSKRELPNQAKLTDPAYWADYLARSLEQSFAGNVALCFDNKGRLYTANVHNYEVTRWSSNGKTKELVFKMGYKPEPYRSEDRQAVVDQMVQPIMQNPFLANIVTKNVIENAVSKAKFPPMKYPIAGLINQGDGHLFVLTDPGLANGVQKFDYFGADGTFIGSGQVSEFAMYDVMSSRSRMVFRGDKVITTAVNEDGDIQVVTFQFVIE